MRSLEDVALVHQLVADGLNDCEIARRTGIPRSTVRDWRTSGRHSTESAAASTSCAICGHEAHDFTALPEWDYSYLLGLYLGDGSIIRHQRDVYRLNITLDVRYPLIILACAASMMALHGRKPGLAWKPGCVDVNSYSKAWPCLFPQHGPGRKHERLIALVDWQQEIVDREPEAFVRGLIQSDGYRGLNRVQARGKWYQYPRYQFSNVSDDIRRIFTDALDALGIEWRRMNAKNISVAKRAAVARLDEFVGPKA